MHPNKIINNIKPFKLPERLWNFIVEKSEFPDNKKWGELGKKGINKIVNVLSNDIYHVKGKQPLKKNLSLVEELV